MSEAIWCSATRQSDAIPHLCRAFWENYNSPQLRDCSFIVEQLWTTNMLEPAHTIVAASNDCDKTAISSSPHVTQYPPSYRLRWTQRCVVGIFCGECAAIWRVSSSTRGYIDVV